MAQRQSAVILGLFVLVAVITMVLAVVNHKAAVGPEMFYGHKSSDI